MNTMRRRNKKQDFIGKLPDCLLLHIISVLPYKEAARTAILSRRWRRVLPRSRIVELDETKFVLQSSTFVEFARDFIGSYDQSDELDKFSVTLSISSPQDHIHELSHWLSFAVQKKAKVMLLDFSKVQQTNLFDLPMDVYSHKALETLQLFSCNFVGSQFNNFDSLLHLSLGSMEVPSASLNDLLQNCVSLKSLCLKKCGNTNDIIEIKGQGLRLESLVIDDCNFAHYWIFIKAPNLKTFKYFGKFCNFEIDSAMTRLEEAVLDFWDESEFGEVGDLLFQLFRDLFAVKVLTVCSYTLQIIPGGEEPLGLKPRLKYVKHLILKSTMHENEFYGIRFFLRSCPFLETLTIEIDGSRRVFEEYECPFEENWDVAMPVYECVKRTLKVVEVKGFLGNSDEISLLAYFVRSARFMQNLNIKVYQHSPICLQKARILLQLNKASPNLHISIS